MLNRVIVDLNEALATFERTFTTRIAKIKTWIEQSKKSWTSRLVRNIMADINAKNVIA